MNPWRSESDERSSRSETRRAFLVGEGIAHALAPVALTAAIEAAGLDAVYELLDVGPEGVAGAFERLRRPDCAGANVTMPYKGLALETADRADDAAVLCRAASVLSSAGGELTAHNADAFALAAALAGRAERIAGGEVVILGAGGAAGAALASALALRPRRLALVARRQAQAVELAGRVDAAVEVAGFDDLPRLLPSADLVVNATALGMRQEDPSPLGDLQLASGTLVYDLVYRREAPTALAEAAIAADAELCDGVAHVILQAPETFRLLFDADCDRGAVLEAVTAAIGRAPRAWIALS